MSIGCYRMYFAAVALNIIGSIMCIMAVLFDIICLAVIGGFSVVCSLAAICVVLLKILS